MLLLLLFGCVCCCWFVVVVVCCCSLLLYIYIDNLSNTVSVLYVMMPTAACSQCVHLRPDERSEFGKRIVIGISIFEGVVSAEDLDNEIHQLTTCQHEMDLFESSVWCVSSTVYLLFKQAEHEAYFISHVVFHKLFINSIHSKELLATLRLCIHFIHSISIEPLVVDYGREYSEFQRIIRVFEECEKSKFM